MDNASRESEDTNTDEILSALLKVFTLKTPSCMLLNVDYIVRLSKYSTGGIGATPRGEADLCRKPTETTK